MAGSPAEPHNGVHGRSVEEVRLILQGSQLDGIIEGTGDTTVDDGHPVPVEVLLWVRQQLSR